MKIAPGARFGRYEIVREIGIGSNAIYYLAAGPVVVKVFFAHEEDSPFLAAFVDNAELATTLEHPNLVRLHEAGRVDGSWFLALEYVDGSSLRQIRNARRDVRWSVDQAVALALGVCAGLSYLHDKTDHAGRPLAWVHAHLALSTVFITRGGIMKTNDFSGSSLPGTGIKQESRRLRYMSPEQVRGRRLDRRSDLFALGTILYELTTLRRPFDGPDDFSMLKAIVDGPLEPPSERTPGYSRPFEQIVLRALARDPDRRYQTAAEMTLDLTDLARTAALDVSPGVLARLV
jgi:serine/threonine protein kinase